MAKIIEPNHVNTLLQVTSEIDLYKGLHKCAAYPPVPLFRQFYSHSYIELSHLLLIYLTMLSHNILIMLAVAATINALPVPAADGASLIMYPLDFI
jgi:hypothetical protein